MMLIVTSKETSFSPYFRTNFGLYTSPAAHCPGNCPMLMTKASPSKFMAIVLYQRKAELSSPHAWGTPSAFTQKPPLPPCV